MPKNEDAIVAYGKEVDSLKEFCEEKTDVCPLIVTKDYPVRVMYLPNPQISLFDENVDENGETGALEVICGITASVKNTLRFTMPAAMLKKLIGKAVQIGVLYYHAYREKGEGGEK